MQTEAEAKSGNIQGSCSLHESRSKGTIIRFNLANKTVIGNIGEGYNNLVIFGLKEQLSVTLKFNISLKR